MPFLAAFALCAGLWILAELSVFGLVANVIGLGGAILVTLAISVLGLVLLRRLGLQARNDLTAMLRDPGRSLQLSPQALKGGVFAALGAALLVIPGFLSDCVGIALLLPSWRRLEQAPAKPADPNIIDLSPQDWRRIDDPDRR